MKVRVVSYGAVASKTLPVANSDISNAITSYGRLNLKATTKFVMQELKKRYNIKTILVQQDTDAMNLSLDDLVQKSGLTDTNEIVEMLDQFIKSYIQPLIDESSTEIARLFNARENALSMDREIIADAFISTGRKRYACRIWDNEGVRLTKPKKKIVGLEIKRSDSPKFVKDTLTKVLDYIFDNDQEELIKFIEETKDKYMELTPEEFGIPKGITDIDKWIGVDKGVPQHVKGAINHNELSEYNNWLSDFPKIVNGDKLKMVILKDNNSINRKVLSFQYQDILYRLKVIDDIDKEFMFERSFMSPTKNITDAIGWKTEDKTEVFDLF
jgi:DNA polymerase elongation subunit (family B)